MTIYTQLYHNSYVVALFSFVILCIIFFVFQIGYTTRVTDDGTITKSFSWKYPLAIALIIWIVFNFILYPQDSESDNITNLDTPINIPKTMTLEKYGLQNQEINMANWY